MSSLAPLSTQSPYSSVSPPTSTSSMQSQSHSHRSASYSNSHSSPSRSISVHVAAAQSPHIDHMTHDDLTEEERLARRMAALAREQEKEKEKERERQTERARPRNQDSMNEEEQPPNKRHFTEAQRTGRKQGHEQQSQPFVFQAPTPSSHGMTASTPNGFAADSPLVTPTPNIPRHTHRGRINNNNTMNSSFSSGGFSPFPSSSKDHANAFTQARQWVFLLPIRHGWMKLMGYALLASLFVFLSVHYISHTFETPAITSSAHAPGHLEMELHAASAPTANSEYDRTMDASLRADENVKYKSIHKTALQESQAAQSRVQHQQLNENDSSSTVTSDEIPRSPPTHSWNEPPTPTPSPSLATRLGSSNFKYGRPAVPLSPPRPVVPTSNYEPGLNPYSNPAADPGHGGGAGLAKPTNVILPGQPDAPPVGDLKELAIAESRRLAKKLKEEMKAKEKEAEEKAKKEKEKDKKKKQKEKEKQKQKEKEAKDKKKKDSDKKKDDKKKKDKLSDKKKKEADKKKKDKLKKAAPKYTADELSALQVASKAAAAPRAYSGSFTPESVPSGKIFGDDVVFILPTKSNRHEQVARMVATWGSLVSQLMIFSNAPDKMYDLNPVVLSPPHPEWKPIDVRYHSWRVSQILEHLRRDQIKRGVKVKFYIMLDDVTMPMLDQIYNKLQQYRNDHGGLYPTYAGGPLTQTNFFKSYWKQQQSKAYNLFKVGKLESSSPWLFGFGRDFLDYLGENISVDYCPCLFGDDLALAGMVKCAGGKLTEDRWIFDFFSLNKNSPTEIGLLNEPLDAWRKFDAYHSVGTKEAIDQTFTSYYEKAGFKASE